MRFAVDRVIANTLFTRNTSMTLNAAKRWKFWELVNRFNARPIIHIGYMRQAFVSRGDPNTKLTLDRMIVAPTFVP